MNCHSKIDFGSIDEKPSDHIIECFEQLLDQCSEFSAQIHYLGGSFLRVSIKGPVDGNCRIDIDQLLVADSGRLRNEYSLDRFSCTLPFEPLQWESWKESRGFRPSGALDDIKSSCTNRDSNLSRMLGPHFNNIFQTSAAYVGAPIIAVWPTRPPYPMSPTFPVP